MPSFLRSALKSAAWLGFLVGTVLILINCYTDFRPGGEGVFVEQKGEVGRQPLWLFSLRVHVVAGLICLLAALPQFSAVALRRLPSLHRISGRVYAASVLLLVCPTGIYLALFAKGGIAGQAGFLLLGIATFHTTLRGVTTIRGRDLPGHRRWMTRSFALVATAITFRVLYVSFFYAGLADATNYVVSLWLSILINAAAAEWILRRPSARPALSPNPIPSIP